MRSKTVSGESHSSFAQAIARLRGVIHGDKYLVGAYPPEWDERPVAAIPGDAAVGGHDVEFSAVPVVSTTREG